MPHNVPVPYPTVHHSEQKCAQFYSEWCIVGYGTGASWDFWDWWDWLINLLWPYGISSFMSLGKSNFNRNRWYRFRIWLIENTTAHTSKLPGKYMYVQSARITFFMFCIWRERHSPCSNDMHFCLNGLRFRTTLCISCLLWVNKSPESYKNGQHDTNVKYK